MKKIITEYRFVPSSSQIIFPQYVSVELSGMLLITNMTDNIIIFNFAQPGLGGTVSGNTLTTTYNCSAMSASDSMQIWYDDKYDRPNVEGELGKLESSTKDSTVIDLLVGLGQQIEELKELISEVL